LFLVTLSYATVGYFQYLFSIWMQFYFDKVLHLGGTASKFYAGILQLALAAGMPLGGWLSGRLALSLGVRRGRALVSGFGCSPALLLGLGFLPASRFGCDWFALAHATSAPAKVRSGRPRLILAGGMAERAQRFAIRAATRAACWPR
jgi:hypothetical protein